MWKWKQTHDREHELCLFPLPKKTEDKQNFDITARKTIYTTVVRSNRMITGRYGIQISFCTTYSNWFSTSSWKEIERNRQVRHRDGIRGCTIQLVIKMIVTTTHNPVFGLSLNYNWYWRICQVTSTNTCLWLEIQTSTDNHPWRFYLMSTQWTKSILRGG